MELIFFNYNKDFKTMSGIVLAVIFMLFNVIHFLYEVNFRGFEFYNVFIFTGISIISLNLVAYIGQINKILMSINNMGKLHEFDTLSGGQFLFTQEAIKKLKDTDKILK